MLACVLGLRGKLTVSLASCHVLLFSPRPRGVGDTAVPSGDAGSYNERFRRLAEIRHVLAGRPPGELGICSSSCR